MAMNNELMGLLSNVFKNDIKVTKLCPDIRGKVILISGSNNLGKSYQASKFPNPIFMPFENGLNGLSNVMVLNSATWQEFRKNVKKLATDKRLLAMLEKEPITIVMDNVKKSGIACQRFLEEKYDIQDISEGKEDGNRKVNLYGFYEKEYWSTISQLFNKGYTVIGICHEEVDAKTGKTIPDKDKRSVGVFRDNADITIHLESNGVDDNGDTILSSGYMAETDEFFARCRFPYVDTYLEEFTAENLINAISEGIKRQIEIEGGEEVSFAEQNSVYEGEQYTKDELVEIIKGLFDKMSEIDAEDEFDKIVDENLGGKLISEATDKQIQPLMAIKEEIEEFLTNNSEEAPF